MQLERSTLKVQLEVLLSTYHSARPGACGDSELLQSSSLCIVLSYRPFSSVRDITDIMGSVTEPANILRLKDQHLSNGKEYS